MGQVAEGYRPNLDFICKAGPKRAYLIGREQRIFRHLQFGLKQEKINDGRCSNFRDSVAVLGIARLRAASGACDDASYPQAEFVRGRNSNVLIATGSECV
jgi:hypothetical protein